MSWNRPDVAKKYLFLHGSESEKQVLEDKMFEALSQDKVEFVQLLLEYGVNLQKFLTFKRLSDLYNCVRVFHPFEYFFNLTISILEKRSHFHSYLYCTWRS